MDMGSVELAAVVNSISNNSADGFQPKKEQGAI